MVSGRIVVALLEVLATVYLDDEPLFEAGKVDDVVSNWVLAAELLALELSAPEGLPEALLCVSGIATEVLRPFR